MKTGDVREVRHNGIVVDEYLHVDGWSPWVYHLPEEELDTYYKKANALMHRLDRLPIAARRRIDQVAIRCPVRGCLLATVYQLPRRATAQERQINVQMNVRNPNECEQYLYVGRTASGTEVYDILNYPAPMTLKDEARGCSCCRILYWRAGCRHGTASLDRASIYDWFSLAYRWCVRIRTEEQEVAALPENLRPLRGKKVFHPAPGAWHAKMRSDGRATV